MGTRGPAPAREAERRRTNEPDHPIVKMGPEEMAALPFPIDLSPTPPDPRDFQPEEDEQSTGRSTILKRDKNGWHPYATHLWEKLQSDPSRAWNGPAAIALDLAMCENLSRLLMPRIAATLPATEYGPGEVIYERLPINGSEMAALLKWASARGLYETDRLRIGKEITFYAQSDGVPAPEAAKGHVISIRKNRKAALLESNRPAAEDMA